MKNDKTHYGRFNKLLSNEELRSYKSLPEDQIPKEQILDRLHKIRNKNIKSVVRAVASVTAFGMGLIIFLLFFKTTSPQSCVNKYSGLVANTLTRITTNEVMKETNEFQRIYNQFNEGDTCQVSKELILGTQMFNEGNHSQSFLFLEKVDNICYKDNVDFIQALNLLSMQEFFRSKQAFEEISLSHSVFKETAKEILDEYYAGYGH